MKPFEHIVGMDGVFLFILHFGAQMEKLNDKYTYSTSIFLRSSDFYPLQYSLGAVQTHTIDLEGFSYYSLFCLYF